VSPGYKCLFFVKEKYNFCLLRPLSRGGKSKCIGYNQHVYQFLGIKMKILTSSIFTYLMSVSLSYATNLAPYAAHWCIDSTVVGCTAEMLEDWKPTDIINQFYTEKTPLAHSFQIANSDKTMQIIPFIDFDTSRTPAQMSESDRIKPQITFWQNLQRMTYFGGSQGEGQVLAPQPGWIKAAHQNGVKILGSIFFSPIPYGGDKELNALYNMLNNPVVYVNQLVLIAKTLGFDGYFINNEADESTETNNKFSNFIQTFHNEAKKQNVDLSLDWYQVPASSVASLNKNLFVDSNGNIVSDNIFLDYGWVFNPNGISSSVANWNYPLSQLDFGIYDANYPVGWMHQSLYDTIFPNNKNYLGSISEFAFEEILNPHGSEITFNQELLNETYFWSGAMNWKGAANYVPTITAITSLPFSTSFNTGQGDHYFLNGIDTGIGAWYDMEQQDLLPTWRFQVNNDNGNTVNVNINYAGSYIGGSDLLIQGTISPKATSVVNLYATHIDFNNFSGQLELNTIYKSSDTLVAQLCLHMTDNTESCYFLTPRSLWKVNANKLAKSSNKIIDKLFIKIKGIKSQPTPFTLEIGHIFIGSDEELSLPSAPAELKLMSHDKDEDGKIHYYISWDRVPNAKYYHIYADGNFVGRTNQTIFDVITNSISPDISISSENSNALESEKIHLS
jgi:endo-beta-N-acetylglucosaminidase D